LLKKHYQQVAWDCFAALACKPSYKRTIYTVAQGRKKVVVKKIVANYSLLACGTAKQ
jgi:hypothetical protein